MSVPQKALLSTAALLLLLSCIGAPYPEQMYLQHIPTVVAIAMLVVSSRRYPLSNAAFTCLIVFLMLHILGARYIYSYVPYDRWMKALLGTDLTSIFHFQRNHYDRLVHFAFGLLWALPAWEVCIRTFKVPRRFAFYVAFEFVLAFSALYELFEWGLTMVLSPNDADAYNGQQGDLWDAHKDMAFAMLGSLVTLGVLFFRGRRYDARHAPATLP
jgi:putative membrane protein